MPSSYDVNNRLDSYSRLSATLSRLTDDDFRSLISTPKPQRGWGVTGALDLDGQRLFLKRVPLTDVEAKHAYSTSNLYGMPTYYSYGVGSAGFGVYRELAACEKATAWVLSGECASFPLMYHHRILSLAEPWGGMEPARQADYVRYWNGSDAIGRYMSARAAARHEAVIVLEHFPYTLASWLGDNQEAVDSVIRQLLETITFLRGRGIVHFDVHFSNVVTDGMNHYLTDFGLLLDTEFDLAPEERAFLARHVDYDYGEALMSVGAQLLWMLLRLSDDQQLRVRRALDIDDSLPAFLIAGRLITSVEDLAGLMPVDEALVYAITRFRPVMLFMQSFLDAQRANPVKDTPFDEQTLRRLLSDSGVLSADD